MLVFQMLNALVDQRDLQLLVQSMELLLIPILGQLVLQIQPTLKMAYLKGITM